MDSGTTRTPSAPTGHCRLADGGTVFNGRLTIRGRQRGSRRWSRPCEAVGAASLVQDYEGGAGIAPVELVWTGL